MDAGLDDADCIVCGVETLESVDAGDVELDLEPNPAAVRFKPLDATLVADADIGALLAVDRDIGLNRVRGGDIDRVPLGADIAEVGPATNGVRPVFSSGIKEDEISAGTVEESALIIGMSLILGDDDEREFVVIWPNPRLTWKIILELVIDFKLMRINSTYLISNNNILGTYHIS